MITSSISVQVNNIPCVHPDDETTGYLLQAGIRKINEFTIKSGFDYGHGVFLLTRSDLDLLVANNVAVRFTSRNVTSPVLDGDGNEITPEQVETDVVELRNLILVQTSMLMTPEMNDNCLFLVYLADRRYYSNRDFIGIRHSLFPTTDASREHPDAGSTWETILNAYWAETALQSITGNVALNHDQAAYPAQLIKDVQYLTPTSSLKVISDVLKMIGHGLYAVLTETNMEFTIRPLRQVIPENTTLLESDETLARRTQRKANVFIDATFTPSRHDVFFRSTDIDSGAMISVDNPIPGGDFVRSTTVFNCATDEVYENTNEPVMQELADQISELIFDSYSTANQIDTVYFGLINVVPSPRCDLIQYFHDLTDGKFKTKIKSHQCVVSYRPQFKLPTGSPLITIQAPEGGIPAASNYNFTPVNCDVLIRDGNRWVNTGETKFIYNPARTISVDTGLRIGFAMFDGQDYVLISTLCDDDREFVPPEDL